MRCVPLFDSFNFISWLMVKLNGMKLHTDRPSLVERDGFLMHTGQATHTFDWQQLSTDLEEERVQDILGR